MSAIPKPLRQLVLLGILNFVNHNALNIASERIHLFIAPEEAER